MEQDKNLDVGINAKLNWEQIIFELMSLIHNSGSLGEIKKNMDFLEAQLNAYEDKDFKADKETALKDILSEAQRFKKAGIPASALSSMEWNYLVARYKALLKLAYRRKALPQREIKMKVI